MSIAEQRTLQRQEFATPVTARQSEATREAASRWSRTFITQTIMKTA
jgi:hypothetical protein